MIRVYSVLARESSMGRYRLLAAMELLMSYGISEEAGKTDTAPLTFCAAKRVRRYLPR